MDVLGMMDCTEVALCARCYYNFVNGVGAWGMKRALS